MITESCRRYWLCSAFLHLSAHTQLIWLTLQDKCLKTHCHYISNSLAHIAECSAADTSDQELVETKIEQK